MLKLEFLFSIHPAERREALKAELDRLKGDPTGQKKAPAGPDSTSISASKGSITLQELRLPLKADFVCSTANRPGTISTFNKRPETQHFVFMSLMLNIL